ncbi:peptide arginase family protein [Sinomicrobium oceani]|uniref:UPF0489 family protein n=1 Tax=Sinomicrobium oceani TaxID=1150368 RepID=UPI00227BC968|nr:UPF0489 family protein [Sinomicrobium oceani]
MLKGEIPCFVVEEHHEVILVWAYLIKNGLVKSNRNTLLHIDDHSDMSVPFLDTSIDNLFDKNYNLIKSITYNQLGIASFIVPAIYLGFIDQVSWVKCGVQKNTSYEMYTCSLNGNGKDLMLGKAREDLLQKEFLDLKTFIFNRLDIQGLLTKECRNKNILLDIDLDYFSSIENPQNEIKIQITKSEYLNFKDSTYHPLKFEVGKIEVSHRAGKYYYIINQKINCSSRRKVDFETIDNRIDDLVMAIKRKGLKPNGITISRSRYSGYTPIDQWQYIEQELLSKLKEIYEIRSYHISDLHQMINENEGITV